MATVRSAVWQCGKALLWIVLIWVVFMSICEMKSKADALAQKERTDTAHVNSIVYDAPRSLAPLTAEKPAETGTVYVVGSLVANWMIGNVLDHVENQ